MIIKLATIKINMDLKQTIDVNCVNIKKILTMKMAIKLLAITVYLNSYSIHCLIQ